MEPAAATDASADPEVLPDAADAAVAAAAAAPQPARGGAAAERAEAVERAALQGRVPEAYLRLLEHALAREAPSDLVVAALQVRSGWGVMLHSLSV
jgi:hypothetical protein